MREFIIIFIFLLVLSDANGQVIVLEEGDSTYQEREIFDDNDTTNIWKFRQDLPKGKYWVIEQTACGSDTSKYAEFIDKGIKHGTWIEWETGMCFGTFKENTEEVESWDFAPEKKKYSETVYDSGYLVKSILFHIGSNQPLWEHHYPARAIKENEWTEERIWREDGTLISVTKVNEDWDN